MMTTTRTNFLSYYSVSSVYEPGKMRENAIAFATLPQDFSENVIATETSYRMLDVLSFGDQELGYAQPP